MADTRSTETPLWFVEPTFGARFVAAFVDGFLLICFGVVIGLLIPDGGPPTYFVSAVAALYTVGAVALAGRTIGKRLFGLRVADLETGAIPSLRAAVLRWFVPAVPGFVALVPAVAGVGWLALALTAAPIVVYLGVLRGPLHRGLHDHAAGTVVTADAVEA